MVDLKARRAALVKELERGRTMMQGLQATACRVEGAIALLDELIKAEDECSKSVAELSES